MKAKALEIRWHDTQPIFSADFHAVPPEQHRRVAHPYAEGEKEEEKMWRLATAGGDRLVRLWLVHPRPPPPPAPLVLAPSTSKLPAPVPLPYDGSPKVEYLATLKQHTGVVNVVRFSPVGEMLASAGDDGNILFWVPGESSSTFGESAEDKAYEKESWRVKSMLRTKSGQEIYDLAWSPDGSYILAGSVDQTASIYDVAAGQLVHTIAEHSNYVQGVAWDPHNHFIATQSSDRSMHIYSLSNSATTGLQVHAVGKNSRMEVAHQAGGTWRPPTPAPSHADESDIKDKGKDVGSPRPLHRSASHASESDRSDTSAAPRLFPSTDGESAMDPPAIRPPGSRRSSTASTSNASPALLSLAPPRHVRSPSPAPLPAIRPASPKPAQLNGKTETQKLYGDANSTPFFRRLCWSTDGNLLLTPAGLFEDPYAGTAPVVDIVEGEKKKRKNPNPTATGAAAKDPAAPKPTVYIYSRSNVARPPIAHLPGHKTTSLAIRFCPILLELRKLRAGGDGEDGEGDECLNVGLTSEGVDAKLPGDERDSKDREEGEPSLFDLPYRMVYAVATLDAVYLYDTQQAGPICMFGNLHYAPFTDLSWSADGQTLVVSSQDGYCSVIAFDPLELGTPYHSAVPTPPIPSLATLPALFNAAVAAAAPVEAAQPVLAPAPVKRAVEEGEAPEKKKPKRAQLKHIGPLGGAAPSSGGGASP